MLSPEICERCRIAFWGSSGLTKISELKGWACAGVELHYCRVSDPVPPKECQHKFEHAVAESVNIDKTRGVEDA